MPCAFASFSLTSQGLRPGLALRGRVFGAKLAQLPRFGFFLGPFGPVFSGRWPAKARNNPYKESHHPRYTPLHKVPDSAILEAGLKRFADSTEDVAWLEDKKDRSARSLERQIRSEESQ